MNPEETLLIGTYDHEHDNYLSVGPRRHSTTTKSEFKFISRSSVPLIITFFLQYFISVTSIIAAGKLGPKELAAASLAVCTFNITGLAIFQGMATSLDSLCSQAYGSGNLHHVGIYFQRCSAMGLVFTIPLSVIWWYLGKLLQLMIPDQELVILTQQYLRYLTAGAPGLLLFETGKRFLQAQHLFDAATWVLVVMAPINFVLHWILVWHPVYGLGLMGAPIAVSIVYWLMSLLLLCYVLFVNGKKCWNGLDLQRSFSNWGSMLSLAIPGVVMVEAEYLAFEVLTILAAAFGTEALAAQSITSNVAALTFQLPFAIAVAASTRIGHFVGSKDIRSAKIATRISFYFATFIALFNFSFIYFGRRYIGSFFTDSEDVLRTSDVILTLAAFNQIGDAFNVLGAGVLRGQGRQRVGSVLNLVSYYLIALPVGFYFAFPGNKGLVGLWMGLILGVIFLALGEGFVIWRSDWEGIIILSERSEA